MINLADTSQLRRWRDLLAATPPDEPGDRTVSFNALRTARGRPFLTAAVRIVDDIRVPWASCPRNPSVGRMPTAQDCPPLAALPLRRRAAEGAAVADAVWAAYVRWRLGDVAADAWLSAFAATLDPVALIFTADDNPEPWWQNEMVILHAAHSYALRRGDAPALNKTLACADFHLREIQPDHATNEPWSIHAYASHADGNVTAETLLHAGFIQGGGTLGPVARLIARDAADALAVFLSK